MSFVPKIQYYFLTILQINIQQHVHYFHNTDLHFDLGMA